jgi:hypothetical protein
MGHVAPIGEKYTVLIENDDHKENLGFNGRIILRWMFKK